MWYLTLINDAIWFYLLHTYTPMTGNKSEPRMWIKRHVLQFLFWLVAIEFSNEISMRVYKKKLLTSLFKYSKCCYRLRWHRIEILVLQNTQPRYQYSNLDRVHSYFKLKSLKYHSLFWIYRFTHNGAFQQLFAFDIKQTCTFINSFS